MNVFNIHQREFRSDPNRVGALIDSLASSKDGLWPKRLWPPMKLDLSPGIGASGGHGPVKYVVEEYCPGQSIRFRFLAPKGFDGFHSFELVSIDDRSAGLRHTLKMKTHGWAVLSWLIFFRPMHDALLEDAFAVAEASLGLEPRIKPWSPCVKFLRWSIMRGRARKQATGLKNVNRLPESAR
jgi:hypothetical protein